MKLLFNK